MCDVAGMPDLMDGKKVAESVYQKVLLDLSLLPLVPKIVFILVGENAASQTYVKAKEKKCLDLGLRSETVCFAADVSETTLLSTIRKLNDNSDVHGILVQLPLPPHIDRYRVLGQIGPGKDVDGLHPENAGLLQQGRPRFAPCTPAGVMEMLRFYEVPIAGARAVVLGRSEIVGKPMVQLLTNADATVTVCHSKTVDLATETSRADILIVAIGRAEYIRAEHVKEGAVVVDVGIHRVDGKLVGDVHFASASTRASKISPVPGGVGPMTIASLMRNLVRAASLSSS